MSPQLGDFLPSDYKKKLAAENFKEGGVFKCYYPPADKEKRFIIAGFRYDKKQFASVFINTEINPNLFRTEKLKSLHLPFELANRTYLEWDSFVDCSQLIPWETDKFLNNLEADTSLHLGSVSPEDFKLIKATIKIATTISPSNKKNFGLFL